MFNLIIMYTNKLWEASRALLLPPPAREAVPRPHGALGGACGVHELRAAARKHRGPVAIGESVVIRKRSPVGMLRDAVIGGKFTKHPEQLLVKQRVVPPQRSKGDIISGCDVCVRKGHHTKCCRPLETNLTRGKRSAGSSLCLRYEHT